MSRKARVKSKLGIYLVNLKSVEDVEFDSDDWQNLLDILLSNQVSILAYTLFDDSFVLVIQEDYREIDLILRQNIIKFAKKYNKKNNREGSVFAGRYASYAANELSEVWQFISNTHKMINLNHKNTSSIYNYFEDKYIDYEFCLNYFKNKDEFIKKCNEINTIESGIKLNDEELENYIVNTFKIQPHNITKLPENLVGKIVNQVFIVTKASARQIARITSLPLRFLWNLAKKIKVKPKEENYLITNKTSNRGNEDE